MPPKDAVANLPATAAASSVSLSKLSDAQIFSKDPEQYTEQDIDEVIARLTKTLARFRKARQDSQEIAEATAKMKATNIKARKAKSKKTSAQVFEEIVNDSSHE